MLCSLNKIIVMQRYPGGHHPVPGIPPAAHAMYKVDHVRSTAPPTQPLPKPPCDFHPVCLSLSQDSFCILIENLSL